MRRLAKVTATWGRLWYLDPKTALLPDPLLSGYTGKWSIRVTDWAERSPRTGGHPVLLEAELKSAPNGGTMLKGQVSPTPQAKMSGVTGAVVSRIIPFIFLGVFITGLVLLSRGYIASAMPDLLIPVGAGVLFWYAAKASRRKGDTADKAWDEARTRLLRKVADTIDATIDSPATASAP